MILIHYHRVSSQHSRCVSGYSKRGNLAVGLSVSQITWRTAIDIFASSCRDCERWLQPPNSWVVANPESKELLAVCLRRLRGLNKGERYAGRSAYISELFLIGYLIYSQNHRCELHLDGAPLSPYQGEDHDPAGGLPRHYRSADIRGGICGCVSAV